MAGWNGGNPISDVSGAPGSYVRDTKAPGMDLNADLRHDTDSQPFGCLHEQKYQSALQNSVRQLAHVPLHHLAIEVFAVGAVEAGVQVLVDVHQDF